jgi:hypothetical protein
MVFWTRVRELGVMMARDCCSLECRGLNGGYDAREPILYRSVELLGVKKDLLREQL